MQYRFEREKVTVKTPEETLRRKLGMAITDEWSGTGCRTIRMLFGLVALDDGEFEPLLEAFKTKLSKTRRSQFTCIHGAGHEIKLSAVDTAGLLLTELIHKFCQTFQQPRPHHFPGEFVSPTSPGLITTWLESIGKGFGFRFASVFLHRQMPFVWSITSQLNKSRDLIRRYVIATVCTELIAAGASNAELKAIRSAIDDATRTGHKISNTVDTPDTPKQTPINPVLWQLLLGTHDKASPLSTLRYNYDMLEAVS